METQHSVLSSSMGTRGVEALVSTDSPAKGRAVFSHQVFTRAILGYARFATNNWETTSIRRSSSTRVNGFTVAPGNGMLALAEDSTLTVVAPQSWASSMGFARQLYQFEAMRIPAFQVGIVLGLPAYKTQEFLGAAVYLLNRGDIGNAPS